MMLKNLTLVTLLIALSMTGSFAASDHSKSEASERASRVLEQLEPPTRQREALPEPANEPFRDGMNEKPWNTDEQFPEGDFLDLLVRSKNGMTGVHNKLPLNSSYSRMRGKDWVNNPNEETLTIWWLAFNSERWEYNRKHFVIKRTHDSVNTSSFFRNSFRRLRNSLKSNMMFLQFFENEDGEKCIRWISSDNLRDAIIRYRHHQEAREEDCNERVFRAKTLDVGENARFSFSEFKEPVWNRTIKISDLKLKADLSDTSIRFHEEGDGHHRKWTFYKSGLSRYSTNSCRMSYHFNESKAQKDLFMDMLSEAAEARVKSTNANPPKVDDEDENGSSNGVHPMIMETNVFVRSKPTKEITEMRTPETTDAIELFEMN